MEFVPVIGLEVHAQLNTRTKIFCGCSTQFGAPPNENTCPVCLGLPGALPVLNETAVQLAGRAALALDCKIHAFSRFARKNYFYPDLPKGYQISQYDQPLATEGRMDVDGRSIRIKRVQMEEDAGKLIHESKEGSYVDFNRAGVPLIEIVTEPDLTSAEEAYQFLKQLKAVLQFCDVSEANMEEGNLRCDANISISASGSEFGTRVEIKNLNSFRHVAKALSYEYERQKELIASGRQVIQETRLFDADRNRTEPMRSKEEAEDYRYFPDPDLLPLKISSLLLETQRALPELPRAKKERFIREYQLSSSEAEILTEEKRLAELYEETTGISKEPKQSANWILRDVLEKLKNENRTVQSMIIGAGHLAGLIQLVRENTINSTQAKNVFEEMWRSGKMPHVIVAEKGMSQITDAAAIEEVIDKVFAENPDVVERFRAGENRLLGVLVGMVMKKTGGKTNPAIVNQLIKKRI